jgi:alpha/beta superfamily hydrolase
MNTPGLRLLAVSTTLSCLIACSHKNSMSAAAPASQRGDLLAAPAMVASYSPSDLLGLAGGNDLGKTLLQLTVSPTCTIAVFHLQYQTVDPTGQLTPASGALMVPSGANCQGGRPLLLYAHGTAMDRGYNFADLTAGDAGEALVVAIEFAAQGYIVVAPNYVGYDTSTLGYHPYLNADQQSKDMIDALTAARAALPNLGSVSSDGGKLFVGGYSQGGYVAMATHRAMQAAGMTVTAAAPMSGPYALSALTDAVFEGQVNLSAVENTALLATSYQHAYGNVYASATDVFETPYAAGIDALLPSTVPVSELVSEGKLPNAEFSPTPPVASLADLTPATAPANLAAVFAQGFGTPFLVSNTYRLNYVQDAGANPDGGLTGTDGLPPSAPANGFRQDLKLNDLRSWVPAVPVLLCGGSSDPTSFFLSTTLMQSYWAKNGGGAFFSVLDVDSAATANDPYAGEKAGFAAAEALVRAAAIAGGATDFGDEAVFADYHAGLVPPFCITAAKSFFDAH